MESHRRDFSDLLPIAVKGEQPETYIDFSNLVNTIKLEILEDANDDEKKLIKNLFQRIEIASLIIDIGDTQNLIYRGAIELKRILPSLSAFRLSLHIVERLDELSQVHIQGGIVPSELDELELLEADIIVFEALGRFGWENDQYNEQVLSSDFYPVINGNTQIGDIKALEIADWLVG